jgi:hypothetical protein
VLTGCRCADRSVYVRVEVSRGRRFRGFDTETASKEEGCVSEEDGTVPTSQSVLACSDPSCGAAVFTLGIQFS